MQQLLLHGTIKVVKCSRNKIVSSHITWWIFEKIYMGLKLHWNYIQVGLELFPFPAPRNNGSLQQVRATYFTTSDNKADQITLVKLRIIHVVVIQSPWSMAILLHTSVSRIIHLGTSLVCNRELATLECRTSIENLSGHLLVVVGNTTILLNWGRPYSMTSIVDCWQTAEGGNWSFAILMLWVWCCRLQMFILTWIYLTVSILKWLYVSLLNTV